MSEKNTYISKYVYLLLLIIIVGVILRFIFPGVTPPSLNWDEASLGYNAYSILKTGKDEWGRTMPLSFEAFGDYKLPGYIYTDVPFIATLGLNEFSVRLPSAIAGIFSILLMYLLVYELTRRKDAAFLSSFLFAIAPVSIFFSRAAIEANLAVAFFLAGFYLFLIGFRKTYYFIPSSIFFGLSVFTYNSARIFVTLFLLVLIIFYRKKIFKLNLKEIILPFIILAVMFGTAGYLAIFTDSSARYFWVTILDQGAINRLNEARGASTLPSTLTKLIYNRYTYFVLSFIENYFSHFSINFLFLTGGSNHQYSVPNTGFTYLIDLPFLLLGIFKLIKEKSLRVLIFSWILIAPIPSAITREAPSVIRDIFWLGGLQIISSFGILSLVEYLKKFKISKTASLSIIISLFIISLGYYLYQYFVIYPVQNSSSWQYGMKQAINFIQDNPQYSAPNKKIFITKNLGEPHIYYLFYTKYDPSRYQNNPTLIRYYQSNWTWVDRIDNIYFVNDWQVKQKVSGSGNLLITSPGNYPTGSQLVEIIKGLNGSPVFDIVKL